MPNEFESTSTGESSASTSVDHGGEQIDFKTLFGDTKRELEETKSKADRAFQELESTRGESKKTQETLERMRKALGGIDTDEVSDPVAKEIATLEDEIQEWVRAAHEADKAGKPMNRTAKVGIELAQTRINAIKQNQAYEKKIKDLEDKVNKATDPERVALEALYKSTDQVIQSQLATIFGNDPRYASVKEEQFNAIARQVGKEFQSMQNDKENPEDWKRLMRDPKALTKLVAHVVKENIPPVARKMMEDKQLADTPFSMGELMGAFREAKSEWIKSGRKDEAQYRHMDNIRKQIMTEYANNQFKSKRMG